MTDEVKLLPCERDALNDRIKQLRAERKHYFDCEGDGVDVLLIDIQNHFDRAAIDATRPPVVTDEVVERVAEAIYDFLDERFPDGAMPGGQQLFATDHLDAEFKHEAGCEELARAILASMPAVVSGGQE